MYIELFKKCIDLSLVRIDFRGNVFQPFFLIFFPNSRVI